MEYREGCPVCEHNDLELERDLRALAQLLFGIYLAEHGELFAAEPESRLDNIV